MNKTDKQKNELLMETIVRGLITGIAVLALVIFMANVTWFFPQYSLWAGFASAVLGMIIIGKFLVTL